jgi:hypothetical protein
MDMDEEKKSTSVTIGGGSFPGLLCIAFIVLKLTGYITWSWWWVLSPLWIPVTLGLTLIMSIAVIVSLFEILLPNG